MTRFRVIDDAELVRRYAPPTSATMRAPSARVVPPPPPAQCFEFGELPLAGRHRHRCGCRREFTCTARSCTGQPVLCVVCALDRKGVPR